jgi:hypothetical protein
LNSGFATPNQAAFMRSDKARRELKVTSSIDPEVIAFGDKGGRIAVASRPCFGPGPNLRKRRLAA